MRRDPNRQTRTPTTILGSRHLSHLGRARTGVGPARAPAAKLVATSRSCAGAERACTVMRTREPRRGYSLHATRHRAGMHMRKTSPAHERSRGCGETGRFRWALCGPCVRCGVPWRRFYTAKPPSGQVVEGRHRLKTPKMVCGLERRSRHRALAPRRAQ